MFCSKCGTLIENQARFCQKCGTPVTPVQPQKKKSKKPLLIILGAVVLVILVVAGIIIAEEIKLANDHEQAVAHLDAGEYQLAYDEFTALGDYEDSADLANEAYIGINYLEAKALFDEGEYESAKDAFQVLANIYYADAADWVDQCDYAIAEGKYNIADEKYNAGDHYGAYNDFILLGDFLDAAERAESCADPYPDTGELTHNKDYVSSSSKIEIDGKNTVSPNYFKIYEGDTLVSSLFVNAGDTATVNIPAGNYTIKQASGRLWFGEEVMFGDEGYYEVLLFDNDADSKQINNNIQLTLTLQVFDGNTDSDIVDRDRF